MFLFLKFHQRLDQGLDFIRVPFPVAHGRTCHITFGVDNEFYGSGVDPVLCAYLACLVKQVSISEAEFADITFDKGGFFPQVNT